jgi:SAM-dependent methyltransferase
MSEPEAAQPGFTSRDLQTAEGFAAYFRTLGAGSRYTPEQFADFFAPLDPESFRDRRIVELGFGHGSFLWHWGRFGPARLCGVDLGDALDAARAKLAHLPPGVLELHRGDLTEANLGEYDLAYCIGVIHHLAHPEDGFRALLRHTRAGGSFHGWVYSREGNALVIHVIDRVRRVAERMPLWATRWIWGLAVALPAFVYAKALRLLAGGAAKPTGLLARLPAADYALSIADRDFAFFHFLATDFLVARRTVYLDRATLERWLAHPEVEPGSVYLVHRNGNSWKFGGRKRA